MTTTRNQPDAVTIDRTDLQAAWSVIQFAAMASPADRAVNLSALADRMDAALAQPAPTVPAAVERIALEFARNVVYSVRDDRGDEWSEECLQEALHYTRLWALNNTEHPDPDAIELDDLMDALSKTGGNDDAADR